MQAASKVSHPVRTKDLSILFWRRINVHIRDRIKQHWHHFFPISDLCHYGLLKNILIPLKSMGKIDANLKTRWLSLLQLLLHIHSHFLALCQMGDCAHQPRHHLVTTGGSARHRQCIENTDSEKNQTCRCSLLWSTPANESTQGPLLCRYNQDFISIFTEQLT